MFIILSILAVISYVDIKTLTIPNPLIIILALLSIYQIVVSNQKLDMLYGGLFLTLFFLVFFLLIPGSFGFGDVKLAAVIGTFCGLSQSVVVLESSLITGAVCGIIYMLARNKGLKAKMPFGPFLALGFVISIFYGVEIALIYFRFIN
jgi:prepilin signal peptidase PulO-like enzyme (type II secretory pathway)